MMYSIFMLKGEAKSDHKLFMNYDWTMAHGGVVLSEYKTVYTGHIEPKDTVNDTLESIYTMFNLTNRPEGYRGRSMSVSDLVALEETGTFFCDHIGFKKIN